MENRLFSPLKIGKVLLDHRVVMAPLTRMRATPVGAEPTALHAQYYAQRASPAGLIISEATHVSVQAKGFPRTPGMHSAAQEAGWKQVVDAVHEHGGRMYLQLWHTGRVSHSSHHPDGAPPVAPSAIRACGNALTADFRNDSFEWPRELDISGIRSVIDEFRLAALRAMNAGFDGVEIHAANGFLIDQFLQDGSNRRNDQYGGSLENRNRLLSEILQAVVDVCTAARVGVRLSPFGNLGGVADSDPQALFTHVVSQLSGQGLAYLHLIEPRANTGLTEAPDLTQPASAAALFRHAFDGPLIASGGFTPASAQGMIESGNADAIAFGRAFISNPDLPHRLATGAALTPYDRATFYGGDSRGYTDYPALAQPLQDDAAATLHPQP